MSGLVDGELDNQTMHRAEVHLTECSDCRKQLEDAEEMDAMLRLAIGEGENWSSDIESRIYTAIGHPVHLHQTSKRLRIAAWAGWITAAAACIPLTLSLTGNPSNNTNNLADNNASNSTTAFATQSGSDLATTIDTVVQPVMNASPSTSQQNPQYATRSPNLLQAGNLNRQTSNQTRQTPGVILWFRIHPKRNNDDQSHNAGVGQFTLNMIPKQPNGRYLQETQPGVYPATNGAADHFNHGLRSENPLGQYFDANNAVFTPAEITDSVSEHLTHSANRDQIATSHQQNHAAHIKNATIVPVTITDTVVTSHHVEQSWEAQQDLDALHHAAILLRVLRDADGQTFTEVHLITEVLQADDVLERLSDLRNTLDPKQATLVDQAWAALEWVNGPINQNDLQYVQQLIERESLSTRMEELSNRVW